MIAGAMNNREREWLETDGLGGFASGTVAGVRTRRYHGLLVTPMTPPTGRMLGHVSEVADADAPHRPGGCPFQAWSLGELLRLDRAVLAEDGAGDRPEPVQVAANVAAPAL